VYAEDGNVADDFKPWPEANSQDAATFNDVPEAFTDDPESEEEYWDNGWNRSSSIGEEDNAGNNSDYLGDRSPSSADRLSNPSFLTAGYVEDVFGDEYGNLPEPGHEPPGLAETTQQTINGGPHYDQYLRSQQPHAPVTAHAEPDSEWRETTLDKLSSFFGEGPDVSDDETDGNYREASNFNDDADDIVAEFQKSAAAGMLKTAGRNFTFQEQQELIDEPGVARHLSELNLANSFYEDDLA
jgi:hypothetical protein